MQYATESEWNWQGAWRAVAPVRRALHVAVVLVAGGTVGTLGALWLCGVLRSTPAAGVVGWRGQAAGFSVAILAMQGKRILLCLRQLWSYTRGTSDRGDLQREAVHLAFAAFSLMFPMFAFLWDAPTSNQAVAERVLYLGPARDADVRALVPLFHFARARVSGDQITDGVTLGEGQRLAVDAFLRTLRPCISTTEAASVVRVGVVGVASASPFRRYGRIRPDSDDLNRRVANERAAALYAALLESRRRNAIEGIDIEPPRPYVTSGDLEAQRESLEIAKGMAAGDIEDLHRAAFVRLEQTGRCELLVEHAGALDGKFVRRLLPASAGGQDVPALR